MVAKQRSASVPLWARVLEDLQRRIAAGEFSDRFPTDLELVRQYKVSRHTARDAVRRLQDEGLLERRRGRGSFVTQPAIEQPLGALYSLFRSIEARGVVQESVVRILEERHDDKAAAMLACPGEPLVYLERLRLADGEPIALDSSWLPAALAGPLLSVDFTHTGLYLQLAEQCSVRVTSGWERIRPVLPDRLERDLLALEAYEPAFRIERMAYQDKSPIEWRHSVVRGDRFSFVARWGRENIDAGFEQITTS